MAAVHHGQPEDLRSTLFEPGLDRLTVVLRGLGAIAPSARLATSGLTADELVESLALSFAAHPAAIGAPFHRA